jgi:hypothetical protein
MVIIPFPSFAKGESMKKLGKPVGQTYLQSFTITDVWRVEVTGVYRQRIGLKFFIVNSLSKKVPL